MCQILNPEVEGGPRAISKLEFTFADKAGKQRVILPDVGSSQFSSHCIIGKFEYQEDPLTSINIYGKQGTYVTGIDLIYDEGNQFIGDADNHVV